MTQKTTPRLPWLGCEVLFLHYDEVTHTGQVFLSAHQCTDVTIPPAQAGGFVWTKPNNHYHAKANWPTRDAIKSGAVTNPLVARFLAALMSAWSVKPQRRQENAA